MALTINKSMLDAVITQKLLVKDGVVNEVTVDGVKYMDITTYPVQEGFDTEAVVIQIERPFIDFAVSCGGKGKMTAQMITAKFGTQVSDDQATFIAADFAKGYLNYRPIPSTNVLILTMSPYLDIFQLCEQEEPAEEEPVE